MQDQISFKVYNASAGSGKTFTLVKEYLKILLEDNNRFRFQQILAVTFTNKAAGEMKDRVLSTLNSFAQRQTSDMLGLISSELQLPIETIFERSTFILNAILQHYSGFNITTIDSFTHRLIKNFAFDLGLPMTFDVEMDVDTLLNEAVDLVISKIGQDEKLTALLVNFSLQKSEEDKSWDIANDLRNFSEILLNENHDANLKQLENATIDDFSSLKKQLLEENVLIEKEFHELGKQGLEIIEGLDVVNGDFSGGGDLPRHFNKLLNIRKLGAYGLKFVGRLNTAMEKENLCSGKCSASAREQIEGHAAQLHELYNTSKIKYENQYSDYVSNKLVIDALIPLAVLNYIHKALSEIKEENGVLLNAEFNKIIHETIKNEPAPFIYERIGEKYRYYFIDEMQDTSVLQWQNLIPLVDHALSTEGEEGKSGQLMLVGDAKQSIYRWRGGKASQFIELSKQNTDTGVAGNPFHVNKRIEHLETNYRSAKQVVEFNNGFFSHIARYLENQSYKKLFEIGSDQKYTEKESGYVQLTFVNKKDSTEEEDFRYPKAILNTINNLDPAFQRNEVCVLVRTKKQGMAVADYLAEHNVAIISSETLVLDRNAKVRFIVNLLQLIQNPSNEQYKLPVIYFLFDNLKTVSNLHMFTESLLNLNLDDFFKNLDKYGYDFNYDTYIQFPFYEGVNYIIKAFDLTKASDANIQYFLDVIFEFQQKKRASIDDFLEFWELKKEKFSVVAPEAKNAVRIMTIHKAKGLEFPVVIFPYDLGIYKQHKPKIWYKPLAFEPINTALVSYSPFLELTGEVGKQLYNERQDELEFDNYNLLYVTFTRASEQLYIIAEKKAAPKRGEKIKTSSGLFIDYLKELDLWNEQKTMYSFGTPIRRETAPVEGAKTIKQDKFIASAWKERQISIVANSALHWDTELGKAVEYGNLIHGLLAKIITSADVTEVVDQYSYKGLIGSEHKKAISDVLTAIVTHEKLRLYFAQNNEVFNEREILTSEGKIVIPDRLVFKQNSVTIIDYKTGHPKPEYQEQLNKYEHALKELGFEINQKILVYISPEIIVQEF